MNCLITGASSGIGNSISIELSKYVRHIYIVARDIKNLESTHDKIVKNGCSCTIVPLDLCVDGGIKNLSKQIFLKDKYLDLIVLSAGKIDHLSPVDSIDLEKMNKILKLNFISNFRMIKCFHSLLKNAPSSQLAVISSNREKFDNQYWGIYQPIMTALNELVMIYAKENKNSGIKANIFCPQGVDTKLREVTMPGENKDDVMSSEFFAKSITKLILNCKLTGEIINI